MVRTKLVQINSPHYRICLGVEDLVPQLQRPVRQVFNSMETFLVVVLKFKF